MSKPRMSSLLLFGLIGVTVASDALAHANEALQSAYGLNVSGRDYLDVENGLKAAGFEPLVTTDASGAVTYFNVVDETGSAFRVVATPDRQIDGWLNLHVEHPPHAKLRPSRN